jgi:hypothetical protein
LANIRSDSSLWKTFQQVIKDGNLTDADIRSLRVETGASDAIFRDLINDGLKEVSSDLSKYVTSNKDFDFENGQISVQDANGNELWDGTNGIKVKEYRDLLGYDDDQMGQDRIKEWKNATWESFKNDMPNLQGGETRQEKELTIFGKKYIFNPNSTTKDDFFAQVLDPYLTDETDGRRILEVIKRNENPGTWKFNEDDNGNYTWDYFNPEQDPAPPEEKDPDDDLYAGGDWDKPDLDPWKMEYQNIEKLGRFYDMNFYEEDLALDTEKAWRDLSEEEKKGLTKDQYKAARKRNVLEPAETWAQEQQRLGDYTDTVTEKYEMLKKNKSYSFDDVNTVLSLFQPDLYEVPTYGFKADIRKRQDVLDEMARFNPDPISSQSLVSVLPEYEQPEYKYTPPDRDENYDIELDPLNPGDPFDPDEGKPEVPEFDGNDPGIPDDADDSTPEIPEIPSTPGDEEEPKSWQPGWDERLFTGGKNQWRTKGSSNVRLRDKDGTMSGYVYSYDARKDGTFDYTIKNQEGRQLRWEDLDDLSRRNIENQFNFDR